MKGIGTALAAVVVMLSSSAWAYDEKEVDQYLCDAYNRVELKKDSHGDFTWTDPAAAARFGVPVCQYVIGGMEHEFKFLVYNLCKSIESMGMQCNILSGFRCDYRQKIASGFKARGGNSRHGGSRRTKGYGDGQAIDLQTEKSDDIKKFLNYIDKNETHLGLRRPMPKADPFHIEPMKGWTNFARVLRGEEPLFQLADISESVKKKWAKKKHAKREWAKKRHKSKYAAKIKSKKKYTRYAKKSKKHRNHYAWKRKRYAHAD